MWPQTAFKCGSLAQLPTSTCSQHNHANSRTGAASQLSQIQGSNCAQSTPLLLLASMFACSSEEHPLLFPSHLSHPTCSAAHSLHLLGSTYSLAALLPQPETTTLHQLFSPVANFCPPLQISVFDRAAEMFCGDACKMTRLLGSKTCCEVHARLQVRHPELLKTAQAEACWALDLQ